MKTTETAQLSLSKGPLGGRREKLKVVLKLIGVSGITPKEVGHSRPAEDLWCCSKSMEARRKGLQVKLIASVALRP
jgi:hypothetical protein